MKMICALILSGFVFLCGMPSVHAQESTQKLIEEMVKYYVTYQEAARTDVERILDEMADIDADEASIWSQIMDYWTYAKTEMDINLGVAPDGLPKDDSLCFVVLGFKLNDAGTMQDELIGRLQVARASAEKYPNAYVAVTGGGTAANNPDATEADSMVAWLIEKGIDPKRVIVENKASTTSENAQFTYDILRKSYPQVNSLCLITSDYHVPRGCLLMNAELLLSAHERGD